ncbi:uncharacterized protein LOC113791250 [Dermatophagoides pteronyssinus]|uniref:Uncharacterized protein LOC113791250 n=1 Tax=Dermatophagoides pteronyssinus TaxID=6956 RepID=A0A6P6XTN5_DERPT|nr:uncharacterized protein LOC113791250 [Dermatophagoides pteronyssinus]
MIKLSFNDNSNKRLFSQLLIIIMTMNNVCVNNGSHMHYSFFTNATNTQMRTKSSQSFPYKSVYGLPISLNCSKSIHLQFSQCEISFRDKWFITNDELFYQTRKFCCFVWDTLNCEINIAIQCSYEYSQKLEKNTLETFTTFCEQAGYKPFSFFCDWAIGTLVAAGVFGFCSLLMIGLICYTIGMCIKYRV